MIFQLVDNASGSVIRSIAASDQSLARNYIQEGATLYEGGPLHVDRGLIVKDGVLIRRPGAPAAGAPLNGEGETLMEIV